MTAAEPTLGSVPPSRERALIFAFDNYGSGQHPCADASTLPFFTRTYAIRCLTSMASDAGAVSQAGIDAALDALDWVKALR